MKSTLTMAFQCTDSRHTYMPILHHSHSILHTGLECWFQIVNVKPHTVNTEHLNSNESRCNNHSRSIYIYLTFPILYVRLWLSSPKWFPLFLVNFGLLPFFVIRVYLGEMNCNPLHIWWVFRGFSFSRVHFFSYVEPIMAETTMFCGMWLFLPVRLIRVCRIR